MALIMLALWCVQYRTRNAGTVDVAWAFGTGVVGVWFALGAEGVVGERQWLVAAMVAMWGARLGVHLLRRVGSEREDGRYRYMRDNLGDRVQPVMFGFFQIQALWSVLFALPIWAAAAAPSTDGLAWHDWAGLAVWIAALGGEAVADRQLARFRAQVSNQGQVCNVGLWAWSRHPNYFFEWLHWFAYALIAWGSTYWWVTLTGVVLMYFFLTRVTGIPWTEQQALRSRGDAYRHYQQTTPAFFPSRPTRRETNTDK
ncbi:MAG: steroid 5-alpha reductase family enzyme [Gammaproteobacteria bacterium]|jgi:steroid 5-alpha reductase family enzyme